jgi:Cu(I)/Ag(I) efflux system protein CusF
MNRIVLLILSTTVAFALSPLALAQPKSPADRSMDGMPMPGMDKATPKPASHSGTGVVKAVDAAAGSVTLAHEPIKTLNWPAMTMAFKVQDKSLLDKAKPGQRVQFTVVQSGKDYVVTSIK